MGQCNKEIFDREGRLGIFLDCGSILVDFAEEDFRDVAGTADGGIVFLLGPDDHNPRIG